MAEKNTEQEIPETKDNAINADPESEENVTNAELPTEDEHEPAAVNKPPAKDEHDSVQTNTDSQTRQNLPSLLPATQDCRGAGSAFKRRSYELQERTNLQSVSYDQTNEQCIKTYEQC